MKTDSLISLLSSRFDLVKEISIIKYNNSSALYDSTRESQALAKAWEIASNCSLNNSRTMIFVQIVMDISKLLINSYINKWNNDNAVLECKYSIDDVRSEIANLDYQILVKLNSLLLDENKSEKNFEMHKIERSLIFSFDEFKLYLPMLKTSIVDLIADPI